MFNALTAWGYWDGYRRSLDGQRPFHIVQPDIRYHLSVGSS